MIKFAISVAFFYGAKFKPVIFGYLRGRVFAVVAAQRYYVKALIRVNLL